MPTLEDQTNIFLQKRQELRQAIMAFNEVNRDTIDFLATRLESHLEHRDVIGNPHGLTKEDFGLGNIDNVPPATAEDILNGVNEERLLTPYTYKLLLEKMSSKGGGLTNSIRTPVSMSPQGNEVVNNISVTLTADEYRTLYRYSDGSPIDRQSRSFQVDTVNGDFSVPVWEGTVSTDFATVDVDLLVNQEYKWRCKDIDIYGQESAWSVPGIFSTQSIGIERPTITMVGGGSEADTGDQLTATALKVIGGTDVLNSVRWDITLAGDNNVLWSKTNFVSDSSSTNLLRLPLSDGTNYLFDPNLEPATWYSVTVTYITASLGEKESTPFIFRTVDTFKYVPGSFDLDFGDSTLGTYGSLPPTSFLNASEVLTLTGLAAGSAVSDSNPGWVKLSLNNTVVFFPVKPIRVGMTFTDLDNLGLIAGKSVDLEGTAYTVKTPSLADYNAMMNILSVHGNNSYYQYSNSELGINSSYSETILSDGYVGDGNMVDTDPNSVFKTDGVTASIGTVWRPMIILN